MYEIPQRVTTKNALNLNIEVIVFYERNISSIVSDSAQHWSTFLFFQNSHQMTDSLLFYTLMDIFWNIYHNLLIL